MQHHVSRSYFPRRSFKSGDLQSCDLNWPWDHNQHRSTSHRDRHAFFKVYTIIACMWHNVSRIFSHRMSDTESADLTLLRCEVIHNWQGWLLCRRDYIGSVNTSQLMLVAVVAVVATSVPRPACWQAKPKPSYSPANMATTWNRYTLNSNKQSKLTARWRLTYLLQQNDIKMTSLDRRLCRRPCSLAKPSKASKFSAVLIGRIDSR